MKKALLLIDIFWLNLLSKNIFSGDLGVENYALSFLKKIAENIIQSLRSNSMELEVSMPVLS